MTQEFNRFAIIYSGFLLVLSGHLHAENTVDVSLNLQMGLVTSASTSWYRDVDEEYFLFPLVMAEYGRYYLDATNVGYRVYQGRSGFF